MALGGFSPPFFFTQYRFYPNKSMTYEAGGRGEPVFVNKNNALRGIVECAKINFIKGLRPTLEKSKSVSVHSSHATLAARRRLRQ